MHTPRGTARPRSNDGFSLVELMLVIILIGIVTAIAVPSFGGFVDRNRTNQAINRFTTDVAYARMLAVRTGRDTRIQPLDNGTRYEVQWDSAGTWQRNRNTRLSDEFRGVSLQGEAVRFDPRGLRSDAGDITLRRGSTDHVILVSAAGRVIVSR
jgi:type II secretion system protein H